MADARPPFPGATKITFRGYSAWYSREELEEMRSLPDTEEGENAGRLIHEAKVFADATLIPSERKGVVAVGSGSQWDERRNTSGVRPGRP